VLWNMFDDSDNEQKEIVGSVKNLKAPEGETHRKGKWNKFFGDATNRMIIDYLENHLPDGFTAIGPGAYIEEVARELDLIIVRQGATPIRFTNAYHRDSVYIVVEVKRRGVFYKKREAEERMREHRDELIHSLSGLPLLYITVHESEKLIEATRQVYGENAFFLSTGYEYKKVLLGEWRRFVNAVLGILSRTS